MTKDFQLTKGPDVIMKCSASKPCFCYGKVCLVPNNANDCNKGNAFLEGTPLCGVDQGWDKKVVGKIVCQELGFQDIVDVTAGLFGEAISKNGWFYLSKTFRKSKCNKNKNIK